MLQNIKIGDRVRSCLAGWGMVEHIYPNKEVTVNFVEVSNYKTFLPDGKYHASDIYPEIIEVVRQEWEPEGGQKIIRGRGSINEPRTVEEKEYYRKEGRAYPSYELANKAYAIIRPFQRLVAYVLEHALDYELDWEHVWYITYNHRSGNYEADSYLGQQPLIQVFMPKKVARELAHKLNSGEVKL